MFNKEKSLTLKILNTVFLVGIIASIIVIVVEIVATLVPVVYKQSSNDGFHYVLDSNIKESNTDALRLILLLGVVILVSCAALRICNKDVKIFNVEKPTGLKIVAAGSVFAISNVVVLIFRDLIYGTISSNPLVLLDYGIAITLSALTPVTANAIRMFDIKNNRWLDTINGVLVNIFSGVLMAMIYILIHSLDFQCEAVYYCDVNGATRLFVTTSAILVTLCGIIFAIKVISSKDCKAIEK